MFRPTQGLPHERRRAANGLPVGLYGSRLAGGKRSTDISSRSRRHARHVAHRIPAQSRCAASTLHAAWRGSDPDRGPHRWRTHHARPDTQGADLRGPRWPLHLGGGGRDRPRPQHRAGRALHVERHVLHAMRGRRLPQDHLLPRPPRRDGRLHRADRKRPARAAVERQPGGVRPRLGRMARPLAEACVSLRAGGGRPCGAQRHLHHDGGARGGAEPVGARGGSGQMRLRHGGAEAVDGVG